MFDSRILKFLASLPLCLMALGCSSVDSKPVAVTAIPSTMYEVRLFGPDSKNHYHYEVCDGSSPLINRFLGPAQVSRSNAPELIELQKGRYRINWGSGDSAFTIIDADSRRIVRDSNLANQINQAF